MKIKCGFVFLLLYTFMTFCSLSASETSLTIIHSNDLASHFLGYSPNKDYTPETTGDDETKGGWARIATVIKSEKAKRSNPVLVLDGGDFLIGSLFHMVSREHALELQLLDEMGCEVTTLGNHDFDLKPTGLASIVESAAAKSKLPKIVASNLIFNSEDPKDDRLEQLFKNKLIQPYTVIEKDNLRIGIFGLLGKDAAEVSPFAAPVKFAEPIETAKKMVSLLREEEKVDLVICLSHSGLSEIAERSEDEIMAKEVSGIDVIISGHSHDATEKPLIINDTIIVHAGENGLYMGVLDLAVSQDKTKVRNYTLIDINDDIKGDEHISNIINVSKEIVNREVLKSYNLSFDQNLVETEFNLNYKNDESNLGNLLTDAVRWAVNQAEYDASDPNSRVQLAVQSNGGIRDDLIKGKTGLLSVSDLFRTVSLGIGLDGTMSYPLISFYIYGSEIKKIMEILTTVYPLKGSDYFLQFSGAKINYNPNRMLFDRVSEVQIEQENGEFEILDVSESNTKLYKITSNFYNSTFLKVIGGFTNGILTIVPKDRNGNPIDDLKKYRVDVDKNKTGIQEVKDWTALMDYVQTFADTDGNGIANMPDRYRGPEGRQIRIDSLNPYYLLKGGNYLTWIAFSAIILSLGIFVLAVYIPMRVVRKRRTKS